MDQKENEKGILNVKVSRLALSRVKSMAVQSGRTLRWIVDDALLAYRGPDRARVEVGDVHEDSVPVPPEKPIDRPFSARNCKPVWSPAGYPQMGVMQDVETGRYWPTVWSKAQTKESFATLEEAKQHLDTEG